MCDGAFHHRHRVTYSECTLGNHVYYARYLDMLEEARGEWMRAQGLTLLELQTEGFAFPVLECTLRFHHPARYDDVLDLAVRLGRAERLRIAFDYRITNQEGRLILEGQTQHVATDLAEKPRRLPVPVWERLRRHAQGEPAAGQTNS